MKSRAIFPLCAAVMAANALTAESAQPKPRATPAPFSAPTSVIPPTADAGDPPRVWTADLGGRDLRFLAEAAEHGLAQIFLGELGKTRGEGDKLKAVAALLLTTQQQENDKLVRLGAGKGVTLGASEAAGQKGLAKKFEKLTGQQFDRLWFDEMIALNQRAIATYEIGVASNDTEIKSFAEKALSLAREKLLVMQKVSGVAPAPALK